jgi:hypothetical protein
MWGGARADAATTRVDARAGIAAWRCAWCWQIVRRARRAWWHRPCGVCGSVIFVCKGWLLRGAMRGARLREGRMSVDVVERRALRLDEILCCDERERRGSRQMSAKRVVMMASRRCGDERAEQSRARLLATKRLVGYDLVRRSRVSCRSKACSWSMETLAACECWRCRCARRASW